MAKKKRVKKPKELSLAQLQELIDEKASEVSELNSQRTDLQRQIDDLDRQIAAIEGTGAGKRGRGRPKKYAAKSPARKKKKVSRKKKVVRAKNSRSAKSYAEEILRNKPKGLTLSELADQILANGYKSNSANFKNTLYQSLYKDRNEGNTFSYSDKTGRWTVK